MCMHRVLVIGSGGAGKSTFARRLARCTGLPLVHLDSLYWKPGWIEPSKDQWRRTMDALLTADRWVMDGNYGGSLEQRLAACDTVVFLDLPRRVCLWRILLRRVKHHRSSRPDIAAGCPERLTWDFVRWVWLYPIQRKPKILQRLSALRSSQRVFVLRSAAEIEAFFFGDDSWAGRVRASKCGHGVTAGH